jgi:hypothetical protein
MHVYLIIKHFLKSYNFCRITMSVFLYVFGRIHPKTSKYSKLSETSRLINIIENVEKTILSMLYHSYRCSSLERGYFRAKCTRNGAANRLTTKDTYNYSMVISIRAPKGTF